MTLNKDLEVKFLEYEIDVDVGYSCLVGIYFELDITKFIPTIVIVKLDHANVINKNYETNKYYLNVDLFQEPNLDWINDYRSLFRGIKPGAMGDRSGVIKKMKKFLKQNNYSPQQILVATNWYIENTDARYIMKAHYFIEKNGNSTLGATLEEADFSDLETDLTNNTL